MKKMLRKHGKKVSVVLLAIALMISPMLPAVKAAGDCSIKLHYYFLEAENAWIDTTYYSEEQEEQANTKDNNPKGSYFTQRMYGDRYVKDFGVTSNELSVESQLSRAINYMADKRLKDMDNGDGGDKNYFSLCKDGTCGAHKAAIVYCSGNNCMNTAPTSSVKHQMTSQGQFYNVDMPEGYEWDGNVEWTSKWTKADWNRFVAMGIDGFLVKDDSIDSYAMEDGDDIYLSHYQWRNTDAQILDPNINDESHGSYQGNNGQDVEWKSSTDPTANIAARITSIVNANPNKTGEELVESNSDLKQEIEWWMNASVQDNIQYEFKFPTTVGDGSVTNITATVTRNYNTNANRTKAQMTMPGFWAPEGYAFDSAYNNEGKVKVIDTWHWYFFPAIATLTFTAPAEYCAMDYDDGGILDTGDGQNGGKEPGSGEQNQNLGVVSYAIIGTLLVGAASAYIYARKSNKFNKL